MINILGLSIGIAVFMFLSQFIKNEISYDKFHDNYKNVYRLQYNYYKNNKKEFESAKSVAVIGKMLEANFPEVQNYCRTASLSGDVKYNQNLFRGNKIYFSSSSIFSIFSFSLVEGDKATILKEPNTCVISKSACLKYFGEENPLGKTIQIEFDRISQKEYTVEGIFEDVPNNSHIKFDILISFPTLINETGGYADLSWDWYDFYNYIEIKNGQDIETLQVKINNWLQNERKETWEKSNERQEFILQPVHRIHLFSNLQEECEPTEQGDSRSVYFLSIVSFIILIIAWFNYIILSTAKALDRAKEIGMRKVLGAEKQQLIKQFLFEAVFINFIAFLFTALFLHIFKSIFFDLTGISNSINFFHTSAFWLTYLILFAFSILASGFLPSIVLSNFDVIKVLKGKMSKSPKGVLFRKTLIIIQYSICIFLIANTLIINKQIRFIQEKDLGFSIDKKLIINTPAIAPNDTLLINLSKTFKNEIISLNQVNNVTLSTTIPGDEISFRSQISRPNDSRNEVMMSFIIIDESFFSLYDIDMLEGRNFKINSINDKDAVILNEKGVYALGFKNKIDCIGKSISMYGKSWEIIGVVSNYSHLSPKSELFPIAFFNEENYPGQFYSIDFNGNENNLIKQLKQKWKDIYSNNIVNAFLLEQHYNQQYKNERLFLRIFLIFTFIAILLANLGMVGFSLHSMQQKRQEIGLRKVFGSETISIIFRILGDFSRIVLISGIFVFPIWYFVIRKWLQNFAYRIDISITLYIIAILTTLILLTITVLFQTINAARSKPIDTLRYE